MSKLRTSIATSVLLLPAIATMQQLGDPPPQTLGQLFELLTRILEIAILVIMSAAVLFFVWGVVQFIAKADSEEGRKEGKRHMIWGIVALFVMTSIWGIIRVLSDTFFL